MATEKTPEKTLTPSAPVATSKRTATPTLDEGAAPTVVITALAPASAAVGDPSFVLRVLGAGFTRDSVIVFAGQDEPTTYFSDGEVQTGMNMPLWQGADPAIPCLVRNADGAVSNTVHFVMDPPPAVPVDHAAASKPFPVIDLI